MKVFYLPRHDKGTSDVAVLYEPLSVWDVQLLTAGHSTGAASIRDGDNDVNFLITKIFNNSLRKLDTHDLTGTVNTAEIEQSKNAPVTVNYLPLNNSQV